jgi:hypothetical protein
LLAAAVVVLVTHPTSVAVLVEAQAVIGHRLELQVAAQLPSQR